MSDERPSGIDSNLARRIAHEVRSPLGVITGGLEQVRRLEDLPPSAAQFLKLAHKSTGRIERLARRLEWIAKLQSGGIDSDDGSGSLAKAVEQAAADAERYAGRSRIEVHVEVGPGDGPTVALVKAVEQAVQELVHNAIVHAKNRVEVRQEGGDEARTAVIIEHDGAPLNADEASFAPLAGVGSGLGLGLWLAQSLLDPAGGRVVVRPSDVTVEWPD